MYGGFWLREARSVLFYEGLRFWGGSDSNQLKPKGGPAEEGPHVRGGSEMGSYEDLMNVWRILALGGSICCVSRGSEALGGRHSNEAVIGSGSAKEGPHVRGGAELGSYEDLMNVSRILAPGASICRVLPVSEALGGLRF